MMQIINKEASMYLISIYDETSFKPGEAEVILFSLLSERKPYQSISHKQMPTYEAHKHFVRSRPYTCWFFIKQSEIQDVLGSVYLTHENEIGIFIFEDCTHKGYGKKAIDMLMMSCSRDKLFYANIAPTNSASIAFFVNLGFTHYKTMAGAEGVIQYTYKKVNPYYALPQDV